MGTWFGAQQQGAQVVRDQTTRRRTMAEEDRTIAKDIVDRQRTQAGEDRDTAYNEEIRRQKLAELQRLNDIRNARASRNPTPAGGFQFGGQGQVGGQGQGQGQVPVGGQGQVPVASQGQVPVAGQGQVPVAGQGQTPVFDANAQVDLATARDASILQSQQGYDAAVAGETQRLGGVDASRGKLLELRKAHEDMGFSQYLPKQPTSAVGTSRAQLLSDAELDNELSRAATALDMGKGYYGQSELGAELDFIPDAIGDVGSDVADWYNNMSEADKAKRDTNRVIRDWYKPGVIGPTSAETYFRNNPGEWDKAKNNLVGYYNDVIKPQIESGTLADVAVAPDKPVFTKEQIAKAEAQHKDYMSKIATGINTLDDDIANAPMFLEKLNKDKDASNKAIQDLYKTQLNKSNAAQLAKVVGMQVDPSLLDPTKLDGLVRQGYEQRQLLLYKAQNARKVAEISGDWAEYDTLRAQLSEKDVSIYAAIGEQGITDLVNNNDPRRISSVLSSFTSSKIIIQPRSDGMYNFISNGKLSGTPRTADAIQKLVRMHSSPTFRAQSAANAQALVEQQIKGADTQQSINTNKSNMLSALLTEQLKGINAKDKFMLEQQFKDREVKFSSLGSDGGGFLTSTDGRIVLFNPMAGKSASGKQLSQFTDVTGQIGKGIVSRINSGTMDFNNSEFWKSIGLPNPLNN